MNAYGRVVHAVRRELRLSQAELAARFGVTTTTISTWERGLRRPGRSTFALLHLLLQDKEKTRRLL